MTDLEQQLLDELISAISEQVMADPDSARVAGFSEVAIDVMTHLTPARRKFVRTHFEDLFSFETGALDEIKQKIWPN